MHLSNSRNTWRSDWLSAKDVNDDVISVWCSRKDEKNVSCVYCDCTFSFVTRGKHCLLQHAKTAKHISKRKNHNQILKISSKKPGESSSLQPSIGLFVNADKSAIIKEIAWTIHITLCNRSELSVDADFEALKFIAPNDLIDFKLHRTKLAYFRKAIASWFKDTIFKDVSTSPFTIMFDDTENNAHAKELQIVLKYYSKALKKLKFVHLESAFLGSATGVIISEALETAVKSNPLDVNNCVMLGADGPNVNKTVKRKFDEYIESQTGQKLMDIGSCHDHNLHNSFNKACEIFCNEVQKLCLHIHEYFESSSKWEKFSKQYEIYDRFEQHFHIRWTTIGPAVNKVIPSFNAIKSYFANVQNNIKEKDQTKREKAVIELLKSDILLAQLNFVSFIAEQTHPLILFLEKRDNINFDLYDFYQSFLSTLVATVLPAGSEKFKNALVEKKIELTGIDTEKIFLPEQVASNLKFNQIDDFKTNVAKFIIKMIDYLNSKEFFHQFLFYAKSMSLKYIFQENSSDDIIQLSKMFTNQKISDTEIHREIVIFKLEFTPADFFECKTIDQMYDKLDKTGKFPTLMQIFYLTSVASVSNAEVERYLSKSNLILDKKSTKMSLETFNERKFIVSGMEFYDNNVSKVNYSASLISKVSNASAANKRKMNERVAAEKLELSLQQENNVHLAHILDLEQARLDKTAIDSMNSLQDMEKNKAQRKQQKIELILRSIEQVFDENQNIENQSGNIDYLKSMFKNLTDSCREKKTTEDELEVINKKINEKQSKVIESLLKKL